MAAAERDAGLPVEIMTLEALILKLNENGTIAPPTIDAIEYHAAALGADVCAHYATLNGIISRYELLIRKRWIKKSPAQRRDVLLAAWPDMQRHYSPDDPFDPMPYINQENLSKAKPLLIFLNARGRHTPWNFACTEEEFCTLGRTVPCIDEDFCKRTTVNFTKNPDPSTFGSINRNRDPDKYYQAKDDYYEICARSSIHILQIQKSILKFLINCTLVILYDIPGDQLFDAPTQEEPSISDLVNGDTSSHTTFSNVLMSAPYRAWHSLNFGRLQGYIKATLDMQKDHIRAMREDPGYLADTLLEYEEHAPYKGANSVGAKFQFSDIKTYRNTIVLIILDESYTMFAGWSELDRKLDEFQSHVQEGRTMHDQGHVTGEISSIAKSMKNCLARKIGEAYLAAPNIRKLMRQGSDAGLVTPTTQFTNDQDELLKRLQVFMEPNLRLVTPAVISSALESVDRILQRSPECNRMMSGRLMSLLTDLSVLGKCIRQISLWGKAPDARKSMSSHIGCNYIYDNRMVSFSTWLGPMEGISFPIHHIYPFKEKLYYPAHKRQTRKNIEAMREAEMNLDNFWGEIDSVYEAKTGVGQHELIRNCLLEGGAMSRTTSWVEPMVVKATPVKDSEYEYQPLSRMIHDKTVEITGSFDRHSITEKSKAKTRGTNNADLEANENIAVQQPEPQATAKPVERFVLDKRAYKVFKTLFHVPASESSDLPGVVKWDEFKRAMTRVGFSVEKLHGATWQFTPRNKSGAQRGIHFNEPHPDNDIPFKLARYFGRRLERAYGWNSEAFRLAY